MRSLSFRTVLIVAAVGFFALGVVTTLFRPASPAPSGRATPTVAATAAERSSTTESVSFLVLGVDALGSDGELMAAWLASFRPPDGDLYLTGFPTDHRLPGGTTLRQAYAEAPDSLEPFAALADLPLTAIIILDADGFGQLIDFVGGVPAGEETVDGQSAVNVLALLDDEPQASLLAQARLLQALSARADRVQPGTDLQPLLDVASMHTTVSIPARDVLTAVAPFLPFTADRIHVSPPGSALDSGD